MAPPRRQLDLRRLAEVLSSGDPAALSMSAIARGAGMAKPTLYRLAGSRAELIAACVDAESERLYERLHTAFAEPVDRDDRAAVVLLAVRDFAVDSPGGFELLFGHRVEPAAAAVRRTENRLADLLRRSARDGPPPRPELSAAALLGAASAVVARSRDQPAGYLCR